MNAFLADARDALRSWKSARLSLAAAVLTLGLGIGSVAAFFSVVDAVLLRPLDHPNPQELVTLWETTAGPEQEQTRVSYANFLDWQREAESFRSMTSFYRWKTTLSGDGEPERIWTGYVSGGFSETLGVRTLLGRGFTAAENVPDGPKVVVLGAGLWQGRYGSSPDVLGRQLFLDDVGHTIVGVFEEGFDFPGEVALWTPMGLGAESFPRGFRFLRAVGRLAPGVSESAAREEMESLAASLAEAHPESNQGRSAMLVPLLEDRVGDTRPALRLLLLAVGLILVIACVNVAGLLVVRTTARRGELALRRALGASGAGLLRRGLVEALLLGAAAGGVGVLLAYLALELFVRLGADGVPRLDEAALDGRALAVAVATALVAGLASGFLPALLARRTDLGSWIKTGTGMSQSRGRRRLLDALVVMEMALALTLLVGAGLLAKSFLGLMAVDLGYDPERVVTLELELPMARYGEPHQPRQLVAEVVDGAAALPGVEAAAAVSTVPLAGNNYSVGIEVEGAPAATPSETPTAAIWIASPGVLPALGMRLEEGRALAASDGPDAPPVVMVSRALADRHWPDGDAVGKRLTFDANFGAETGIIQRHAREIVGVFEDLKYQSLDEAGPAMVLVPHAQSEWRSMYLVARTNGDDPLAAAASLRDVLHRSDPALPLSGVETMTAIVEAERAPARFSTSLLGALALIGLVLASVGVFSVASYVVAERRREIAVRMALGARRETILAAVLRRQMKLAAVSLALGLGASLLLQRLLETQLFGIEPTDLPTLSVVSLLLLATACLAGTLPARRASRVDPAHTLRPQ